MKKKLLEQALTTQAPYVGRGKPVQPTTQQLELLENLEAIDKRSNRVWMTGRPQPVSRLAEDYRKRMGFESSDKASDGSL